MGKHKGRKYKTILPIGNPSSSNTSMNLGRHESNTIQKETSIDSIKNKNIDKNNSDSLSSHKSLCENTNEADMKGNKTKNIDKHLPCEKKDNKKFWVDQQSKNENIKFKFEEKYGDLFDAPYDYSLAHCIAEDMHMNAGIAIEFRKKFKQTGELLDQNKKTGEVAILKDKDRFIYYLVTKRRSVGKPTLKSLENSLISMKDHIVKYDVKKLAMPTIGCGLDRLNWDEVKTLIMKIFGDLNIDILIYHYKKNVNVTSNRVITAKVVYSKQHLKDIDQRNLALFFLKSENNNFITKEMTSLNELYNFLDKSKQSSHILGKLVNISLGNINIFGLNCLNKDGELSFQALEQCLKEYDKDYRYTYSYYGIEIQSDDEFYITKIENILKFKLYNELWMCCPNYNKYE